MLERRLNGRTRALPDVSETATTVFVVPKSSPIASELDGFKRAFFIAKKKKRSPFVARETQ